jgi:hypothetical protein
MGKDDKCKDGKKGGISATVAFFIWLIVLIIVVAILRAIGIRWFSAIVFGLLVAAVVYCAFSPLRFEHGKYIHKAEDNIFGLIMIITFILVVIYIIYKVFTDYDHSRTGGSWWGGACDDSAKVESSGYTSWTSGGVDSLAPGTARTIPGPF